MNIPWHNKLNNLRYKLLESAGLGRILQHINKFNIGMISAFTGDNAKENNKNTARLFKDLKSMGYGPLRIKGKYIDDNGFISHEVSFFVISLNSEQLKHDLLSLGKKYKQESIFFKDRESEDAYTLYSNTGNKQYTLHDWKAGNDNNFLSTIRGKSFYFA